MLGRCYRDDASIALNVGIATTGKRFLDRFDAQSGFHRDRQLPRQNPPTDPVDDRAKINLSPRHRNVDQVRPDLIGADHRKLAQEIGIDFVPRRWFGGVLA